MTTVHSQGSQVYNSLTFNLLHIADVCGEEYSSLDKHLGGVQAYGYDTPIPLLVVLDSNGIEGAFRCINATIEPADAFARDFVCDCADGVRGMLTDERSRNAIAVARRHARGMATDAELDAAWEGAVDAADDDIEATLAAMGAAEQAVLDVIREAMLAAMWAAGADAWDALAARFRARLLAHDPETNPIGEISEPMPSLIAAARRG